MHSSVSPSAKPNAQPRTSSIAAAHPTAMRRTIGLQWDALSCLAKSILDYGRRCAPRLFVSYNQSTPTFRGYQFQATLSTTCNILTQTEPLWKRNLSTSERNDGSSETTSHHWDVMFKCLKEYKAMNGNTLVPSTYPENPQLGNWVDNMRQAYRMRFELERSGEGSKPKKRVMTISDDKIDGE